MDDTITTLLRGVADGSISVDDARTALEGAELTGLKAKAQPRDPECGRPNPIGVGIGIEANGIRGNKLVG